MEYLVDGEEDILVPTEDILYALENLPILARLEFIKNIIFNHGGCRGSDPFSPPLVVANDALGDVIEILKSYPRAAKLTGSKPKP